MTPAMESLLTAQAMTEFPLKQAWLHLYSGKATPEQQRDLAARINELGSNLKRINASIERLRRHEREVRDDVERLKQEAAAR
jgi:outer membrane murein-binding lipoprotein Lpp